MCHFLSDVVLVEPVGFATDDLIPVCSRNSSSSAIFHSPWPHCSSGQRWWSGDLSWSRHLEELPFTIISADSQALTTPPNTDCDTCLRVMRGTNRDVFPSFLRVRYCFFTIVLSVVITDGWAMSRPDWSSSCESRAPIAGTLARESSETGAPAPWDVPGQDVTFDSTPPDLRGDLNFRVD